MGLPRIRTGIGAGQLFINYLELWNSREVTKSTKGTQLFMMVKIQVICEMLQKNLSMLNKLGDIQAGRGQFPPPPNFTYTLTWSNLEVD